MVAPGQFSRPPVTVSGDGSAALAGKDALPWALDTLDLGGDIRGKLLRLQAWIATTLDAE